MRTQTNTTNFMEPVFWVFWYSIYAIARLFLFAARIRLAIGVPSTSPQKGQLEAFAGLNSGINQTQLKS